jgi:prevent-host-death family protein
MKTVGATEAKALLNELLKRVSQGETIRITYRGVPAAKLVPDESFGAKDLKDVVREIRELAWEVSLFGR